MNFHSDQISVEELVCDASFQEYCLGINLSSQLYWEEWIASHPASDEDVSEARQIIYILSAKQGNRLQQLKQLRDGLSQSASFRNIIENVPVPIVAVKNPGSSSLYKYIGAVAASLLIISIAYLTIPEKRVQPAGPASTNVKETTIQSGLEVRRTSILADGSLITLSKHSSIRFKSDFNTRTREVWLTGEAYFDVKPDKDHPFIVHALNNDIKVLGTVFNVKSYADGAVSETFLIRGKVEVIPHNTRYKSVILHPNQKLITSAISGQSSLEQKEVRNEVVTINNRKAAVEEVKWVRNRLNIENEPLFVIAAKLEAWYGIEIVFEDKEVGNYRYSGVFESETVIKSLEALQLSYPFKFRVEQDKISISSK